MCNTSYMSHILKVRCISGIYFISYKLASPMETCTYPSILELSQYQLSYHNAIVVEIWYGGIFDNNAQSDQSTGCTFP